MTSFFPDLNVWFALSVEGHLHGGAAWQWLNAVPRGRKLIFCRQTHLGLIRLLTNSAAMGKRVTAENLAWAAEADWVCEAIVEQLDLKRSLFAQLDAFLPERTHVTTNTSGIQIELLGEGLSDSLNRRLMGAHFFNPPRYLKLLELIPTGKTGADELTAMSRFLERRCCPAEPCRRQRYARLHRQPVRHVGAVPRHPLRRKAAASGRNRRYHHRNFPGPTSQWYVPAGRHHRSRCDEAHRRSP